MTMHAPPNQQPGVVEKTCDTVVSSAQCAVESAQETVHETVEHYPISTAAVVFGIGLGAGVLLGCALADSNIPALGASRRQGNTAEAFGHRVMDSIAGIMPEAVANHLNR